MSPVGVAIPGGHQTQVSHTARALALKGVDVVVVSGAGADLSGIDVVHGFGLSVESIRQARERGIPVCISPIYWTRDYRSGRTVPPDLGRRLGRARTGASLFLRSFKGQHVEAAWNVVADFTREAMTFESADLLLPNSRGEATAISRELGVSTPVQVVPNGVDQEMFHQPAEGTRRSGVVVVGRLDPHKNQLGLIRELRGADFPVRIVGPAHPAHQRYAEACTRASGDNVSVDVRMYSPAELRQVYQSAAVNVLPSWFETTGLTQLEAALCGAKILSTDRGFAYEYFGDLAWYCDPGQRGSIRTAVTAALASPADDRLRQRVLTRYTWSHTAEATLAAYQLLLRRRS